MENNYKVAERFAQGKESHGSNVSTDGRVFKSYGTVIAERKTAKTYYINDNWYSTTTAKHRTIAARALGGKKLIHVYNAPMGCSSLERYVGK